MAVTTSARPFRPTYAVPPGNTIADLLEEHEMTQTELARRLGVTLKHVNQVVNGAASISAELGLGLEKVFGVPADFWLNRESLYRADIARKNETVALESHLDWARCFPLGELQKRGYIANSISGGELVDALLRFLGIASPKQWQGPAAAYRKSEHYESDSFALAAWLRAGELSANEIETAPYDHEKFMAMLLEARALTRLDPEQWYPQLVERFAACGVAVVVIDTFERARANGATRWLTPNKALIQLSLRYRWEDVFWFTFFHEAGHVALHRKKDLFVEGLKRTNPATDTEWHKLEEEANRFASRLLIPETHDQRLKLLGHSDVDAFAEEIGVAPAIVVGRMQHDGVILFSQWNEHRQRLKFAD